ncbi:hypothetical protein FRC04_007712 [Tulasnella sp. 424]|nr:hypothetical protein FRC04_007712 [Tulasnella sp. 424]
MTDESCHVEGCNVPIMLSRDRTQRICVVHDLQSNSMLPEKSEDVNPSRASSHSRADSVASRDDQLDRSGHSAPPTPPTPLSNGPASPTFVLPEPSEETLRRRAQSDLASERIGRKMLQGYAMLGEECMNPDCFGVPLVRPPKRDGAKDPRMECVICGNVYMEARDSRGFTTLQVVEPSPNAASSAGNSASRTSVPGGVGNNDGRPQAVTATSPKKHAATLGAAKANRPGKEKEKDVIGTSSEIEKPGKTRATTVTSSNVSGFQDVLGSIDRSLAALSSRLDTLSKCDPSVLNASSFGDIAKQMSALLETRQAVRREMDASL